MLGAKKWTAESTAMFKTKTGLGINSCVVIRKTLVSEANCKKELRFASECKDWTLEHVMLLMFP